MSAIVFFLSQVELGFRKNPTPILTSASDLLGAKDPAKEFAQMVTDADGGTLFIDEAYQFDPAPKGSTANASNKLLDLLMKVAEEKRDSMTFILAGYKEEMQGLLAYNPGFPSRFPREFTFDFPDYTENQLLKILTGMMKERGLRFQSQKECGVSIGRVIARRIGRGAGTKGFGNARDVS